MAHVLHLNKSGSGMASRTACGRNVLRTPMSLGWAGFKAEKFAARCELCASSKQAEVNAKADARREGFGEWEPVADPDAWKRADDALIAAHRARAA